MDEIVEKIALVPQVTQSQEDQTLNTNKLRHESQDVQHERENRHGFSRVFESKNYLKQFVVWVILFICLFVIAGPLALRISNASPKVKIRGIAAYQFSEERARDYLFNLTLHGSRVSNTRGNFYARSFLVSQIKRISSMNKRHLRFEIDLQNFTDSDHNQLQNILVRVSDPTKRSKNISSLMLSAHYDSVEFSVGASDDGSGVVILLEILSNLVNDLSVTFSDINLIILFTSGEEMGLLGAKAFISHHSWRYDIVRFINIDSSSCNEIGGLIRMKPSQVVLSAYSYLFSFCIFQLAIEYGRVGRARANVLLKDVGEWMGLASDYNIFSLNGSLVGYDFGCLIDSYIYHTSLDEPSMIKQGVIQDLGENLGTLSRNILVGDIYPGKTIEDDSLIYFDIFGRYLIVYKMSTSIIIQRILIILVLVVGIILIIFDELWHRRRTLSCIDCRCIYFHFKYPFGIRIISMIIYFISNLFSICVGLTFSMIVTLIMSLIRPLSWFGNPTLAMFLCSLPCLIGFIVVGYLWNIFHRFILRKWSKNSSRPDGTIDDKDYNEVSFDFEQNYGVLLIYCLLMIVSIGFDNRLFYIILIWSIFICPIYLVLMTVEFTLRWKQICWKVFEQRYHWLFTPLIISLFPLTHTIEIINRLIRILIPLVARTFFLGWPYRAFGNGFICIAIAIPTTFLVLVFIPILQRTKYFARTLLVLLITFLIISLVAFNRQPFTNNHPNIFYAKHISKSIFKVKTLPSVPYIVPLVFQSSSITVVTFHGSALSPVLDHFSAKSGHVLQNQRCLGPTNCTFDDTFNRTIGVQHIQIESMQNFINYTILVRHVSSYNIKISSLSSIKFVVRDQLNIPRTETTIDVTLNSTSFSFDIDISIRRCDLIDSPFLFLFTRLMPNMVLMGTGLCEAIEDNATLIIAPNTFFNL